MSNPKDTDVIFNMTCYYQISTAAQSGELFVMEQLLESPYIRPTGTATSEDMLQKGIVECPDADCVAQDCEHRTVPRYDIGDFVLGTASVISRPRKE